MKKLFSILLISLSFFSLYSEETANASSKNRFIVQIEYRQSTGLIPSLDLLWHYNDTFFSSVYGNYYLESEKKTLDSFEKSKYSVHTNTLRLGADLFGFYIVKSPLFFSLSFGGEYKKTGREEFGYFVLEEEYVIFQNDVNINTFFPFMKLILTVFGNSYSNRFEVSFFPSYLLHVSQDIFFRPLIENNADVTSSSWQKPAVEVFNDFIIPTSLSNILIRASFFVWNAEYDLKVLEKNDSGYYFGEKRIKQTFLEYSVSANLILPFDISGGTRPYLGVGYNGSMTYSSGKKISSDKYLLAR